MKRFVRKQLYWLADVLHAAAGFLCDFASWRMEALRVEAWKYESSTFNTHVLSEMEREQQLARPGDYSYRYLHEKRESVNRAQEKLLSKQEEPKTA